MGSIFPFGGLSEEDGELLNEISEEAELPLFREYAWDFGNNDFYYKDGNPIILEGLDALQIWIYKTLKTERYRYLAYSWEYGIELEETIISSRTSDRVDQTEIERYVGEALGVSQYISEIRDFEANKASSKLLISFTAVTVYGEVDIIV